MEVKYFEIAAHAPAPAAKGVPAPTANGGTGMQIPLMDASDASAGLATMFASLLMGAIKSPDVEQMVMDAIKEVATQKIPRPVEIVFGGKRQVVEDTHQKFDTVLKLLQATRNIMLVGEAGCGKTHLAAQVAHSLSLEFSSVSCSSDMSSSVLIKDLIHLF